MLVEAFMLSGLCQLPETLLLHNPDCSKSRALKEAVTKFARICIYGRLWSRETTPSRRGDIWRSGLCLSRSVECKLRQEPLSLSELEVVYARLKACMSSH